jgi:hypothetical protein
VVSADGSASHELDAGWGVFAEGNPWSPVESRLALRFGANLGFWSRTREALLVPVALTYPVPAGEGGGFVGRASWSSDGLNFIYEQQQVAGVVDHSSVIDTANGVEITRFVRASAAWNAGTSRLLVGCRPGPYLSDCWGSNAPMFSTAYVTSDPQAANLASIGVGSAIWLPDGENIAISTNDGLLIVRADGSSATTYLSTSRLGQFTLPR